MLLPPSILNMVASRLWPVARRVHSALVCPVAPFALIPCVQQYFMFGAVLLVVEVDDAVRAPDSAFGVPCARAAPW